MLSSPVEKGRVIGQNFAQEWHMLSSPVEKGKVIGQNLLFRLIFKKNLVNSICIKLIS